MNISKNTLSFIFALSFLFLGKSLHAQGDPAIGKQLYTTCTFCHNGSGNSQIGAPTLTSLEGWYLERQINAFRTGIRGSNPQDRYGQTCAPVTKTLIDEQAVLNVVAYIKSLK